VIDEAVAIRQKMSNTNRHYSRKSSSGGTRSTFLAVRCGFVAFHFFGHACHKLAPTVHQQQLKPRKRVAIANSLKSICDVYRIFHGKKLSLVITAGDINNSQRILASFAVVRELVVEVEKVGPFGGPC